MSMSIEELPEHDREQMKAALLAWRAAGNPDPMIPMDVDLNGDGIVDAVGLDEHGELVAVTNVSLTSTTYAATGEDEVD